MFRLRAITYDLNPSVGRHVKDGSEKMWRFRRSRTKRLSHDSMAAQKNPQIKEPWESVAQQLVELSTRAIRELIALPSERNKLALDNKQLDDWVSKGSPEWAESFTEMRRIGRQLNDLGGNDLMLLVHDRVVSIDAMGACVRPSRYIDAFWDQIGQWKY